MTAPFSFGVRCRFQLAQLGRQRPLLECVHTSNGLEPGRQVPPWLTRALSEEQHLCRPCWFCHGMEVTIVFCEPHWVGTAFKWFPLASDII